MQQNNLQGTLNFKIFRGEHIIPLSKCRSGCHYHDEIVLWLCYNFLLLLFSERWRVTKATSKLQSFVKKFLQSIIGIHWPCGKELNRNESTFRLEGASGPGLGTPYENQSAMLTGMHLGRTHRGRETKVVLETAEEKHGQ